MIFLPTSSFAKFIKITYAHYVRVTADSMMRAAEANDLDAKTASLAFRVATTWVYIGPCEGNADHVREASESIGIVLNARPTNPYSSAILQMIAILNRDNLGRPSEYKCRFAKELANGGYEQLGR